jgi:hypothetical protein
MGWASEPAAVAPLGVPVITARDRDVAEGRGVDEMARLTSLWLPAVGPGIEPLASWVTTQMSLVRQSRS